MYEYIIFVPFVLFALQALRPVLMFYTLINPIQSNQHQKKPYPSFAAPQTALLDRV